MREVTTIILAAGLSRRMGAQNKLLLPVRDVPMIRHMVGVYRAATGGRIGFVTGHQATEIESALKGSGADICFNADFEQGQPTSVACGLRAAKDTGDILIALGDQPLLTLDNIQSLMAAHLGADTSRISIPVFEGQRGNPILVPAALRAQLLADPRSPGCKKFTRTHPQHVQFHKLASPGFYADVDTPKAYRALNTAKPKEVT